MNVSRKHKDDIVSLVYGNCRRYDIQVRSKTYFCFRNVRCNIRCILNIEFRILSLVLNIPHTDSPLATINDEFLRLIQKLNVV